MTLDSILAERLKFLIRVVRKECIHLQTTDQRLFSVPFTSQIAAQLDTDPDLGERVEAFVGRYGRLQDTVGDRLLPLVLRALGEKPGAVIDNLDRAEGLGLLDSADEWMAARNIRNQMVHEYIEDLELLTSALLTGHAFVPVLIATANVIVSAVEQRGWV